MKRDPDYVDLRPIYSYSYLELERARALDERENPREVKITAKAPTHPYVSLQWSTNPNP
jgi:hypothetical protein